MNKPSGLVFTAESDIFHPTAIAANEDGESGVSTEAEGASDDIEFSAGSKELLV
jgi:hypothetical protein